MEIWQIILASIGYYAVGCLVATFLTGDDDLGLYHQSAFESVIAAIFWPGIVAFKILTIPFRTWH